MGGRGTGRGRRTGRVGVRAVVGVQAGLNAEAWVEVREDSFESQFGLCHIVLLARPSEKVSGLEIGLGSVR